MNNPLETLDQRLVATENEADRLAKLISEIQRTSGGGDAGAGDQTSQGAPSATGQAETDKLKYRLEILKKEAMAEEKVKTTFMKNLLDMISAYFNIAVQRSYPGLGNITIPIVPPSSKKFGDYQCNVALTIASSQKLNPRAVADQILKNFPTETGVVENLEVAGPGFINIRVCKKFLEEEIQMLFVNGVQHAPLVIPQKVLVDFSSPNVAKEMHVGHLRSTIIGDSISRLMEFLGHDVLRINHVGDWGTQFGMLIAQLQDKFPDYHKDGYTLPLSDLQAFYKESKLRFDNEEEFKKRAYACTVQLQSKKPEYIKGWNMICDVSRKEFSKIYERLGVVVLERGESFYQDLMKSLVEFLKSKNFLLEDEGRYIMWGNKEKLPLTVIKSDGGFTYDTSDLAAIRQRIEVEKATWIIYVTDAGQATHFYSIFDCAAKAGILDPLKIRVDHVGFGVVLGDDKKKFKTRSGDTVRLLELLDEGLKRAADKLREKGRDKDLTAEEFEAAQKAVAYGCIKYADLSHSRNAEYVFSFDRMLDDKGNTAVYLLYAYTRIKSIARKAGVSEEDLKKHIAENSVTLDHEKEQNLAKKLLKFPEIVDRVADDLFLHPLCELMYEIATAFTEFYDNCYCIERNAAGETVKIHMSRLALCEATTLVLKKGFDILGLEPVLKM